MDVDPTLPANLIDVQAVMETLQGSQFIAIGDFKKAPDVPQNVPKKIVGGKSLLRYPESEVCPICNIRIKASSWNGHIKNVHQDCCQFYKASLVPENIIRDCIKNMLSNFCFEQSEYNVHHIYQLADIIIFSDKYGFNRNLDDSAKSKGLVSLEKYVSALMNGIISIAGLPSIVSRKGAVAHVSGNKALGIVTGIFSLNEALSLAREYGVGIVTTNCHDIGCQHFYTKKMAEAGFSGFVYSLGSSNCVNEKNIFYEAADKDIYGISINLLSLIIGDLVKDEHYNGHCFFVKGPYDKDVTPDAAVGAKQQFSLKRYEAYNELYTGLKGCIRYSQEEIASFNALGASCINFAGTGPPFAR